MDEDAAAMKRRDAAAASGARICPACHGVGFVEDADWNGIRCPTCAGETWIDRSGKPLKIDPDQCHITYSNGGR